MSSTLDLGVEWRRSKQGGIIKAWWTEVVMQCTGSGGDGNHWGGHKVGRASAIVRSLCELEWGKGERRGWGSLDQAACEQRGPKGKEREGGPVREQERKPRADTGAGIRGAYCATRRGECGTTPRSHGSDTRGPTTDGVRRAHSDSDPACVALSNRSQERRRVGQFNFSDLRAANLPVVFLFLLFLSSKTLLL
jgi:hypothetical protein